jgi:very-short-patch-repair endonuclease
MRVMDERIASLAAGNHGLVCRRELLAMGFTRDEVRNVRRVTRAVHAGVYALRGAVITPEQRILAAVLGAGGFAVASHRSAAHLHGLGDYPGHVEISVLRSQRPRLHGVTVFRPTVLEADHLCDARNIPVTGVARTICDLATVLDLEELANLVDKAVARGRLTVDAIRAVLFTLPRLNGRSKIVAWLAEHEATPAESGLERELHRVLPAEGFSGFTTQLWVGKRRIDAAFVDAKLAVEMDSYLHHSSRSDWAKHKRKQRDLVAAGWRVLPVTKEDLREDRATFVLRLREALRAPVAASR